MTICDNQGEKNVFGKCVRWFCSARRSLWMICSSYCCTYRFNNLLKAAWGTTVGISRLESGKQIFFFIKMLQYRDIRNGQWWNMPWPWPRLLRLSFCLLLLPRKPINIGRNSASDTDSEQKKKKKKETPFRMWESLVTHIHLHTHTRAHTRTHTHACMHAHTHTHTHTYTHTRTHTHTHAHTQGCMHKCTHGRALLTPVKHLKIGQATSLCALFFS